MIAEVCNDKEGRNLNCRRLGGKLGISAKTAHRMLKKHGFRSVKESAKPGLTETMGSLSLCLLRACMRLSISVPY